MQTTVPIGRTKRLGQTNEPNNVNVERNKQREKGAFVFYAAAAGQGRRKPDSPHPRTSTPVAPVTFRTGRSRRREFARRGPHCFSFAYTLSSGSPFALPPRRMYPNGRRRKGLVRSAAVASAAPLYLAAFRTAPRAS
ncbi:hypothetical protein MRX96_021380 [Rhipicephalus microplus]